MRVFEAAIFDKSGKEFLLRLKGVTLDSVQSYLHRQGFTIQRIVEVRMTSFWAKLKDIEFGQRLKPRNRVRVLKTLGQMIGRGYALERVIDFLLADERQKDVIHLLTLLQKKALEGYKDFSELFRVVEDFFDAEFFSILMAGQKTGTVGQNMVDYAEGKEHMLQQKRALIKTLSGKFVLLGIVFLAFLVIVLFVVPQFQDLFGNSLELPLGMEIMVVFSHIVQQYGLVLSLGFTFAVAGCVLLYVSHQRSRYWIQHLFLKLPVLGYLFRMIHTRNFLYMMGNLLSKGVPLMEAISIEIEQTYHLCFRAVYVSIRDNLKRGRKLEQVLRPLAPELITSGQFVPVPSGYLLESVAQAMTLGSKGGNLGEMLTEAYQSYDIQLNNRIALAIRVLGLLISLITYVVIIFMIGSLALTLFRVMEDPTAFV